MSKRALCVGINYQGTGSELAGCLNDAADWSEALTNRGFEVEHLLEQAATAETILAKLREHVSALKYGDILAFTFSGHGSWVPDEDGDEDDERDEILCPVDIESGIWITDDQLHEVFSTRERGARIVMLSDSCHSGTVSRFSREPMPQSAHTPKVRFMPPTAFMKPKPVGIVHDNIPTGEEIMDVRGFGPTRARPVGSGASVLISGCQDVQFSYDAWFTAPDGTERANGAFTRAAIDSLAEIHAPATYRDWHRKIRSKLPSATYPQTPMLTARGDQKRWGALDEGR
ncbi:MAG TPA: caspase family protein [Polyangiaceae bacterium]